MTQQTTIKLIAFSIAGLFLGLILGRTDVFNILYLIAATGLMTLIYILVKVLDFLRENKNAHVTNYIGIGTLTLIVALTASIVTMNILANRRQKLAEELIPKIEYYKQQHTQYPATLSDLEIDNADKLIYWADSTRQNFIISYLIDGWQSSVFDSRNNKWTTQE